MNNYLVAVVQMNSTSIYQDNMKKVEKYVKLASKKGARLIVFPETVDYIGKELRKTPNFSETVLQFKQLAQLYNIYIHCGSVSEEEPNGLPRNTSLLFSNSGEMIGKYSKIHMFDIKVDKDLSYFESAEKAAGNEIVLSNTDIGKIGFSICYDLRFPEMFRIMALEGAQIVVVSANFTEKTGVDHWETLLRARAIENSYYIIASNQTGEKPAFKAHGNSMIVDPWGKIIARAIHEEECIFAEIDFDYINEVRNKIPSLKNRRDDIYTLKTKNVKFF